MISALCLSVLFGTIWYSCSYKKVGEDLDLYAIAKSSDNFVWYKNSNIKHSKSIGSGHAQPFFKTRFNAIAALNLDSTFKIKTGSPFAEGSVIVKELYEDSNIDVYAILVKNASHKSADSRGWVWGYIYGDGSVKISSSKKGSDCSGCHSQSGNEDYILMNKFFP